MISLQQSCKVGQTKSVWLDQGHPASWVRFQLDTTNGRTDFTKIFHVQRRKLCSTDALKRPGLFFNFRRKQWRRDFRVLSYKEPTLVGTQKSSDGGRMWNASTHAQLPELQKSDLCIAGFENWNRGETRNRPLIPDLLNSRYTFWTDQTGLRIRQEGKKNRLSLPRRVLIFPIEFNSTAETKIS